MLMAPTTRDLAGRDDIVNRSGLFETTSHSIQRLVSQIFGNRAVTPPEVIYQTLAHLLIALATRIGSLIQPGQQTIEGGFVRLPVSLEVRFGHERQAVRIADDPNRCPPK